MPARVTGAGGFAHTRLYDLICAAPLIVFYAFAGGGNILLMARQWPHAQNWPAQLTIANEAVTLVFLGLQIVLCLVRRLPLGKSDGAWPRLAAILGANFSTLLLAVPRVALGPGWTIASAALTIGGTIAALPTLLYLGRGFSVLPEARRFVANGPYRLVRHPLYAAEIVSTLGIMLQFRQPWAALIALATIAFQLRRMGFEEDVLRRTFPEYDGYANQTARLIPGIY
jgi:protein-S-isoprenylcysteine O-methyltransferase Ste14